MSDTIYFSVTLAMANAEEVQHALMASVGGDWTIETNLVLMDAIRSIKDSVDSHNRKFIAGTYEWHYANHKGVPYSQCTDEVCENARQ